MTAPDSRAVAAKAWIEHRWNMPGPTTCTCGWDAGGADDWFDLLAAHVADAIVAALDAAGLLTVGEPCPWCPYPACECTARLAAVTTHTRTATDQGPDYCRDCSEAISEWVQWPCPGSAAPSVTEWREADE
jgi:hypothetical protein